MNSQVHPVFGDLLAAIGGAPVSPERRTADEIHGLRETVKGLHSRIRALVPDVEYHDKGCDSADPDSWHCYAPELVEEAVSRLADEKYDRLVEICEEIAEEQRKHWEDSV